MEEILISGGEDIFMGKTFSSGRHVIREGEGTKVIKEVWHCNLKQLLSAQAKLWGTAASSRVRQSSCSSQDERAS